MAFLLVVSVHADDVAVDDYVIGPGDVLQINVYQEDDLSKKIQVAQDGYFSYPLLGKVKAEGLSVSQLEAQLAVRLAENYLVNPHVSVLISEYGSKKVSVSGEVKSQGIFVLSGVTTLKDILAKAGGVTQNAGTLLYLETDEFAEPLSATGQISDVTFSRKRLTVNLEDLLLKGDESLNLVLKNGDSVHVVEAENYFVLGEIKKPGAYKIGKRTNILHAIAEAGGFTDLAARGKVRIIRAENGEKKPIIVNVAKLSKGDRKGWNLFSLFHIFGSKTRPSKEENDIQIQAGDVIVVPESFF